MSLNILDIVFIIIILLSIFFGILKGLVRELFSLAFFIIAVVLAFLFYYELGSALLPHLKNREMANFAGFISIFVIVLVIGTFMTYFIKKVIVIGPLKAIDRLFGGVFGLLRGILISAIILFGLIAFPVNDNLVIKSKLSPYIMKAVEIFLNILPEKFKKNVNSIINNDRQKDARTGGTV